MDKPILSIITVSYNAEKTIRNTIESILNQTFRNYEYIIVDGLSTDHTNTIICEYEKKFQEKGVVYRHFSEKDTGIYNAMNKGTDLADGMWINFMNADDTYASSTVLEEIFGNDSYDGYDLLYGDVNHVKEDRKEFVQAGEDIEKITWAMIFSHQSTFIRTNVQKYYRFNEKYRISADYDMLLRCYLDGKKYKHIPYTVADFSLMGLCNSDKYKTYLETLNIQEDNGIINQKSFGIRVRKVFSFFRLRFENNKILNPIFKQLIKWFGRK